MSPLLHDQFAQVIDRANAAFMPILSAEKPPQDASPRAWARRSLNRVRAA
jgi:hypothetical protein